MVVVPKARRWRAAVIAGVLGVLATACVTDLTGEVGRDASDYTGFINDDGAMVGRSSTGLTRFDPKGVRVPLEAPPARSVFYHFLRLNNAREVIGVLADLDTEGYPGFWNADGKLVDLRPMIPGMAPDWWVQPADINEKGVVVGYIFSTGPTPVRRLFVVDTHAGTGFLVPEAVTGTSNFASAINDAGVILAWVDTKEVLLIPQGDGSYRSKELTYFQAMDINSAGDVVGLDSTTPSVWKWGDDKPTHLPWPATSEGLGLPRGGMMNDDGTVVFNYEATLDVPSRPVRWKRELDGTYKTYTVFPTDGWQNATMHDLNNKGEAIGDATNSAGEKRPVRWN